MYVTHVIVVIYRPHLFLLNHFSAKYRLPFQMLRFYRKITLRYSVSQENAFKGTKQIAFFRQTKGQERRHRGQEKPP